jgi:hypothetical protein
MELSLRLEGLRVLSGTRPWLAAETRLVADSVALGLDGVPSLHQATGAALVVVQPGTGLDGSSEPGAPAEIGRIALQHGTVASAGPGEGLFARVRVTGTASLAGLVVEPIAPDLPALVHLDWRVSGLGIGSRAATSLARLSQVVTLTGQPLAGGPGGRLDAGFLLVGERGGIAGGVLDGAGGGVGNWLQGVLSLGPATVPGLSLAFPVDPTGPSVITLSLEHLEESAQAPPAAAPRTGPQAGFSGDGALPGERGGPRAHWDAASGTLRLDPLPIDSLSPGGQAGIAPTYAADPLAGGSLLIDPLSLVWGVDGRRYFTGGGVTLLGAAGEPLFWASLPGMVWDEALADSQGYRLFAPLLNTAYLDAGASPWLQDFRLRGDFGSGLLSELFLAIDLPRAPGADPWALDFSVPAAGVLSLAGRPIPMPGPSTLLVLALGGGLLVTVLSRAHRPGKNAV